MHSDTLSDMLIRVKNAAAVNKTKVILPHTKVNEAVLRVMLDANYIDKLEVIEVEGFKNLDITLKYVKGTSAISHIKRISKPGVRIYTSISDLHRVLSGYGMAIISTSKGIMSDKSARRAHLGGEVLAELW